MTDMWFVVDGNVEPDTPRTTISPDKNTAEQTGRLDCRIPGPQNV